MFVNLFMQSSVFTCGVLELIVLERFVVRDTVGWFYDSNASLSLSKIVHPSVRKHFVSLKTNYGSKIPQVSDEILSVGKMNWYHATHEDIQRLQQVEPEGLLMWDNIFFNNKNKVCRIHDESVSKA